MVRDTMVINVGDYDGADNIVIDGVVDVSSVNVLCDTCAIHINCGVVGDVMINASACVIDVVVHVMVASVMSMLLTVFG